MSPHCPDAAILNCSQSPAKPVHLTDPPLCLLCSFWEQLFPTTLELHLLSMASLNAYPPQVLPSVNSMVPCIHTFHHCNVFLYLFNSLRACPSWITSFSKVESGSCCNTQWNNLMDEQAERQMHELS